MTNSKQNKINNETRPPVVVILGHVDHGKTSILDYIRKSKVATSESGGITQHIGAYQVNHDGKVITFIDTPGHEAFSAMRARGVRVADIAILVVAADDGVMPQTREAISHIKKAALPFIVAINKIDKPNADIQKVKNKLLEEEVTLEGYGGDIPVIEVSATTGEGLNDLLDMINLIAELEELKANKNTPVELVVIEAELNTKRGATATLIVKQGIIRINDTIAGSSAWARVKHMEDFSGKPIIQATPSEPVVLLGFNEVPQVGEKFVIVSDAKEAEERIKRKQRKQDGGHILEISEGQKVINIILKADVKGTLEAVREVLRSIESEQVKLRMLQEGVGDITDSDIRLAVTANALVVGFRVKTNNIAKSLAQTSDVEVITFSTIYDLVEGVRASIPNYLESVIREKVVGRLKVLKIFRTEPSRMIIGGRIVSGEFRVGLVVKVFRDDVFVAKGRIKNLKIGEKDIGKAVEKDEVGILFDGSTKLEEGDILEAIEKEKVRFESEL